MVIVTFFKSGNVYLKKWNSGTYEIRTYIYAVTEECKWPLDFGSVDFSGCEGFHVEYTWCFISWNFSKVTDVV